MAAFGINVLASALALVPNGAPNAYHFAKPALATLPPPAYVESRTSPARMGLLDSHPGLQKKTRVGFSLATFALTGAFCAELIALTPAIAGTAVAQALPIAGAAVGPVVRSALHLGRKQTRAAAPDGELLPPQDQDQSDMTRLRGRALHLERVAIEMALEMEMRSSIAQQRKDVGLEAARDALCSARRWHEELDDHLGGEALDARRASAEMELAEAEERVRRLENRIEDDSTMLLEMDARVQNAKAQAVEARVEALAAQPGYFSAVSEPAMEPMVEAVEGAANDAEGDPAV